MKNETKTSVLFVCLGNICRSPTAEAVFTKKVSDLRQEHLFSIDSAGTSDWHIGSSADPRTIAAAATRGYDMSALRGRQFIADDLFNFDYVFAMDKNNLSHIDRVKETVLQKRKADESSALLATTDLFLNLLPVSSGIKEVPDPYHGGEAGFEHVLDLIESASDALLDRLR